jgi:hypothetical protein
MCSMRCLPPYSTGTEQYKTGSFFTLCLLCNEGGHDGHQNLDIVRGVIHGPGEGRHQVYRNSNLPPHLRLCIVRNFSKIFSQKKPVAKPEIA